MPDYPEEPATRGSMTGGRAHQPFDHPDARPTAGGHPHGKPSSWVVATIVVIAFLAGGTALILHLWWLFWVCVGLVVLSVPVGKAVGMMDDTVVWGGTPGHSDATLPGVAREHSGERSTLAQEPADSAGD